MLKRFRKYELFSPIIGIVAIYVVQFLLLPYCFPQYYPRSNEASLIFIVPLAILSIALNAKKVNIVALGISDMLYGVMLIIYNGKGFYGIGLRGISLDGMVTTYSLKDAVSAAFIITSVLIVFQLLIHALCLTVRKVKWKSQQ